MRKFSNNVTLDDVIFSVEKRVSDKGFIYYMLVAIAGSEKLDVCLLSSEQEFRLYKMGVDIR